MFNKMVLNIIISYKNPNSMHSSCSSFVIKLGKVWETPPSFKVLLKFPSNLWRFWQSNNVFWMIWVWKLIEVCFNSNLCKERYKTEAFKGILPLLWFEVRIPPLFIEGKSLGLCVGMSFKLSKDDNFRWLYQIIIG